jgi:hypothetical protein
VAAARAIAEFGVCGQTALDRVSGAVPNRSRDDVQSGLVELAQARERAQQQQPLSSAKAQQADRKQLQPPATGADAGAGEGSKRSLILPAETPSLPSPSATSPEAAMSVPGAGAGLLSVPVASSRGASSAGVDESADEGSGDSDSDADFDPGSEEGKVGGRGRAAQYTAAESDGLRLAFSQHGLSYPHLRAAAPGRADGSLYKRIYDRYILRKLTPETWSSAERDKVGLVFCSPAWSDPRCLCVYSGCASGGRARARGCGRRVRRRAVPHA